MRTLLLSTLIALALSTPVAAIDSGLTYQGTLEDAGTPASGTYDLEFKLQDTAGTQVGNTLEVDNVVVTAGVFTVALDFGNGAFTGPDRFLVIAVRPGISGGGYTALAPRTKVTAAPYAQLAQDANFAASVANNSIGSAQIADGSIASADIADGTVGSADINSAQVQRRVVSTCLAGQAIRNVAADGSVTCESATGTQGPVGPQGPAGATGVTGATGAQGNAGAMGSPGAVGQTGIAGAQGLQGPAGLVGATGNTGLQGPAGPVGATGNTGLQGPAGLVGATGNTGAQGAAGPVGATGNTGAQGAQGNLGPVGSAGATGPTGAAGPQGTPGSADAWSRTGNASTNPATNFLGTTDLQPLVLRTSNLQVARFQRFGPTSSPNITLGDAANSITAIAGSVISGGGAGAGITRNRITDDYGVVAGGNSNQAGNAVGDFFNGSEATVSGGSSNIAGGYFSTVSGGSLNVASGSGAMVPGGSRNCAGGDGSWAGGTRAITRAGTDAFDVPCPDAPAALNSQGDRGTFVWADFQPEDFVSTGSNQFLVRANGGIGFNTATLSTDTMIIKNASSSPSVRVRLQSATAGQSGLLSINDASGDFQISAASGDLLLQTGLIGSYIHTNDRFGVGRRPFVNDLEVAGDASKSTAGDWLANSDRRIKTEIAPIERALDTILKLRPVTFRYDEAYRNANRGIVDMRYYNVIAQEFAEVFPEAVKGSGEFLSGKAHTAENEILQVDTYPAQIVTIAAVQELAVNDYKIAEQLAALKADSAKLKAAHFAENATLRAQVAALLQRLELLEASQSPGRSR